MKLFTVRYQVTYETCVLAEDGAEAAVKVTSMARGGQTKVVAVWDSETLPPETNSLSWAERVFKKRWP